MLIWSTTTGPFLNYRSGEESPELPLKRRWKKKLKRRNSPYRACATSDTVVLASGQPLLSAYDMGSGELLWETEDVPENTGPQIVDDMLFHHKLSKGILVRDLRSGEVRSELPVTTARRVVSEEDDVIVTDRAILNRANLEIVSSPAPKDGFIAGAAAGRILYGDCDYPVKTYTCWDRHSGQTLWTYEITDTRTPKLVCMSEAQFFLWHPASNTLDVLDAASGEPRWSTSCHEASLGDVGSRIARHGERLFLIRRPKNGSNQLLCVDRGTGTELWASENGSSNMAPVALGDLVWTSESRVEGEFICARRCEDGEVAWESEIKHLSLLMGVEAGLLQLNPSELVCYG
jgi:outer membrane protein assembly factor BamB